MKESKGRGSVSRSIRFHKKYEQDKEFRERVKQRQKIYKLRRKKKMNKRCLDCKKLIGTESTRCRECNIKNNRKIYLRNLEDLE